MELSTPVPSEAATPRTADESTEEQWCPSTPVMATPREEQDEEIEGPRSPETPRSLATPEPPEGDAENTDAEVENVAQKSSHKDAPGVAPESEQMQKRQSLKEQRSSIRALKSLSRYASSMGLDRQFEDQDRRKHHVRQAKEFRAKALRYMQLESMVAGDLSETRRDTLRDIVKKHRTHMKGCLELPLNMLFFGLYAMSARLHEDITNVWLVESAMRHRAHYTLNQVNTTENVWSWMQTDMVDILFVQKDDYGDKLPAKDWSRVLLYNQVQGSVIIEQYRDSSKPFGIPYQGPALPSYLASFDANNSAFTPKRKKDSGMMESAGIKRRLNSFEAMWMAKAIDNTKSQQKYEILLSPTVSQSRTVERIKYLQKRRWIDEHTTTVKVIALLLNSELGRPRMEQLSITLSFSRGGGIYNRINLQALFLAAYAEGASGLLSMGVDFLWVVMLTVNSYLALSKLSAAFLDSGVTDLLRAGAVPLEFIVMGFGWVNVGGFLMQVKEAKLVNNALKPLRAAVAGETSQIDQETLSSKLHADASVFLELMAMTRIGISWMTLVLMFRFFKSFRVQPRLAVVTSTLIVVTNDLGHFLVVFSPTFFAYAASGHFLFGRRMEDFSTLEGSIGVCLRIVFENEFEWLRLSDEWYWTAAIWCWSYLILVVLIMMNVVLAIVLDIYNEVRTDSDPADTIFLFFSQMGKRLANMKGWTPDRKLDCVYADSIDCTTDLHKGALSQALPKMSVSQRELLGNACKMEMSWQAKQDLLTTNYLKVGAIIKTSVDEAFEEVEMADTEFHAAPVQEKMQAERRQEEEGELKRQGSRSPVNSSPQRPSGPRLKIGLSSHSIGNSASSARIDRKLSAEALGARATGSHLPSRGSQSSSTPISSVATPRRMVGESQAFPGMPKTPGGCSPTMCPPTNRQPGVLLETLPKFAGTPPDWFSELQTRMNGSSEVMEDIGDDLDNLHWQWHQLGQSVNNQVYGRNTEIFGSSSTLKPHSWNVKKAGGSIVL